MLGRRIVVDPGNLYGRRRADNDDLVLATAVAGACNCIITGDKDLLVLGRYEGVDIISPREFSDYEATALEIA